MKPYTPKPGSTVSRAMEFMRSNCGRATAEELGVALGVPRRSIYAHMGAALNGGAVWAEHHTRPPRTCFETGDVVYAVFVLTDQSAVVGDTAPGQSVSVRRPKVARDVWAYAAGAPL